MSAGRFIRAEAEAQTTRTAVRDPVRCVTIQPRLPRRGQKCRRALVHAECDREASASGSSVLQTSCSRCSLCRLVSGKSIRDYVGVNESFRRFSGQKSRAKNIQCFPLMGGASGAKNVKSVASNDTLNSLRCHCSVVRGIGANGHQRFFKQ